MTKQLLRLMGGVLAIAVVTACNDGTEPVATATVEVLAYVDADNSNDFDSTADDPISGATVILTLAATEQEFTAITGADGIAVFDAVEIGSYTAEIELPATLTGVELASASAPSITVEEDVTASANFRYVYVPGTVSGHAFLGTGDYTDGNVVVPGLMVTVTDGAEEWTAETDAAGVYQVAGLLPGSYTVEVEVPAYLSTTTAAQTVTVEADADATADFGFDIETTHTIAETRAAALDEMVSVIGVAVTATAGDVAALDNDEVWIHDSEGILVYLGSLGSAVEYGDEVLVYGARDEFSGEMQIAAEALLVLGDGTLPEPMTLTASELNSDEYQGMLATLTSVQVDSVDGREVFVSDLVTGVPTVIYIDSGSGMDGDVAVVGSVYDFTGVVSVFGGQPQLLPRMAEDMEELTVESTTVADVRAAAVDETVEVTGTVTEAGTLEGNGFYMEDATAGVFVFTGFGNVPAGLEIGDVVTVSGTRAQYFSVVQIGGTPTVTPTGITVTPVASAITAAQLNSGDFQGQLVMVTEVVVDSIDGSNVFVSDGEGGEAALIRIDSDSDISLSGFVVGNTYTITGVVSNFGGTEQIKPRFPEDVEGTVIVEPVFTIAEARAAADGAPVELTGVVTVSNGPDGMLDFRNAYMQDGTGGILIRMPSDTVVELGDSITVVGTRGSFVGELQVNVDADGLTRHGTGTIPAPITITPAEIEAGEHQGELAMLDGVEVTAVDGTDVTVTDGTTTTLVYIDSDTGIDAAATFTVGTSYDITGVVSRYNDLMELKPRQQSDITAN